MRRSLRSRKSLLMIDVFSKFGSAVSNALRPSLMVFPIVPMLSASGHQFAPSHSLTQLVTIWVFRTIDEIELDD